MRTSIKTFLKNTAKDKIARSANPAIVRASTIYFKTMQELRKHQKNITNTEGMQDASQETARKNQEKHK